MIVAQATGKCHEYEFAGFFCVPIYQCSNDNLIKVAAQGLFDPRCSNHVVARIYWLSAELEYEDGVNIDGFIFEHH